ncbi:MAG TPA: sigma-70 family RNA polymerase sigma factor [Vicinamibacterales bacterium]|nr:sigma-70 family RNA polymerase sigma factor [Vicinamibacterales bacterium]
MSPHSDEPLGPQPASARDLFVSELPTIEQVIAWVCSRYRLAPADAEEFGADVKLRLIQDDYRVLRRFEGRSSLRTYLCVVVQRLFLDFQTAKWGKWRPSAEARRLGPVGVLLERLISRDGHGCTEAVEIAISNHGLTSPRQDVERIAAALTPRPRRRFETDDALSDVPTRADAPDASLIARDREAVFARLSAALRQARGACAPEDQLLLAMRFDDGLSVPDIASALGANQKPLYRRLERLLRLLRTRLVGEGFSQEQVMDLLDDSQGAPGEGRENQRAGPSFQEGVET